MGMYEVHAFADGHLVAIILSLTYIRVNRPPIIL